jgi:hypothetical protein
MPQKPDWRIESDYESLDFLDREQLALEFLRRNLEYQKDCSELKEIIETNHPDLKAAEERFSQRWGLRFRP